jgi:hypothetical protein
MRLDMAHVVEQQAHQSHIGPIRPDLNGLREHLIVQIVRSGDAVRCSALSGTFFFVASTRQLLHIIAGLLVNPRKQAIAHASRIFLIPWQLFE